MANQPCENCICVPMCMNKYWSATILECDILQHYIKDHTNTLSDGDTFIIGVSGITTRFMVKRTKLGKTMVSRIDSYPCKDRDTWHKIYGGIKYVK